MTNSEVAFLNNVLWERSRELEEYSLASIASILLRRIDSELASQAVIAGLKQYEEKQYVDAQRSFKTALRFVPESSENLPVLAALRVFMAHAVWRDQDLTVEYRCQQVRMHYERVFFYWQESAEHGLLVEHLWLAASTCVLAKRFDLAICYSARACAHAELLEGREPGPLVNSYCRLCECLALAGRQLDAVKVWHVGVGRV